MIDASAIAKKKFGQNFLQDESVLRKIVEAMPNNENALAEIGPGLGDLTNYLVDVKSVEAFEIDTDLCKHLTTRFKKEIDTNRFTLHCGDVLDVWQSELLDETYDLVANLPYYVATNIILKALADPKCQNMLVMVQLEVAEKFAAQAGEKIFGALSIITQSVATARIVVKVPPEAFAPPPKIDSAVLLIKKTASRSDEGFEQFLRHCFTQPRKTLVKNLSSQYDKLMVAEFIRELDYQPSIRPHEVSTDDYHQLYKNITRSLDGRGNSKREA